jgi:1-acyl-sn-glycerol-3-phosphate acyltransferase
MFPEGKISLDGRLQETRAGVALLALTSGATVVPAYIRGTYVHDGMVKDFKRRARLTAFFGPPIRFDDFEGREKDPDVREQAAKRIIDAIVALRDRHETDPARRLSQADIAKVEATAGPA